MARVYLARDLRYDKPVAVKVLNLELSAALGTERFLREINILAHLNHPHILPLLDSGETEGSLFYVMPYVAGESLRHRLRRETQLRIADTIAITRDVAGALDYAHRQGIVHRDIRPENILMSEGLALVADFGIARAISLAADDDRITQSGVSPGTPPYMSPEQASGGDVDGRSDVYALGCVLYEMLAGQPPFLGPTTQAILARHLADPVPSLRTVRKTVPEGLEQVVFKALEKVPADRFATAGEFADALATPATHESIRRWWRRPAVVAQIVATVSIAAVALFKVLPISPSRAVTVDSTRYAILPFEREAGIRPLNEDQLLQDALSRWSGIRVVDPFQVRDAVARIQKQHLTAADAQEVATSLGAGRYIRVSISRAGDSVRVYGGLYDASHGGVLVRDGTAKLGQDESGADSAFEMLGDRLLFGDAGPGGRVGFKTGTRSRPARQAFASGLAAIERWELVAADSAFAAATQYDPDYGQALLWLAQVRSWNDDPVATWQSAAERAAARRDQFGTRDRLLSDALLAQGRGNVDRACRVWGQLTVTEPNDFAAWYGFANCLSRDDAVVPDSTSPSRWRFRSSYYRATRAYERAFRLLPSIHKTLSAGSYASVRRLLWTSGSTLRFGRALRPDTTTFASYPSWQGDSLAFVPLPFQRFAGPGVVPKGMSLAVQHERLLFHDIATAWVSAFPESAEALEALAVALELLGNRAALDTLRRARSLATTSEETVRLAGTQVWMLVKFSAPFDSAGLLTAQVLADSLLLQASTSTVAQPLLLASLAALTGRANLAAALSRHPDFLREWDVPTPIEETAGPLLAFAALGGPADSLREIEKQVEAAIDRRVIGSEQEDVRMQWLGRPAALAFPHVRFKSQTQLVGRGNYLLDAEAAFAHGDTVTLRRLYSDLRSARRLAFASDLTFDALYPETWLLVSAGDHRAAIAWLDPTLSSLSASAPQKFVDAANAGALVQAMELRAELAEQVGDSVSASRWARAVEILWRNADSFLQPVVRRMERLTRGAP